MKIQIYEGKAGGQKGKWRWRIVARNGRKMGNGVEGYTTCRKAQAAYKTICLWMASQ